MDGFFSSFVCMLKLGWTQRTYMFQKTAHDCWCLFGRNSTFALWDQIITGYHIPKTPPSSPSSTAHHTQQLSKFQSPQTWWNRIAWARSRFDNIPSSRVWISRNSERWQHPSNLWCLESQNGWVFDGRDEWLAGCEASATVVKGDILDVKTHRCNGAVLYYYCIYILWYLFNFICIFIGIHIVCDSGNNSTTINLVVASFACRNQRSWTWNLCGFKVFFRIFLPQSIDGKWSHLTRS